MTKEPATTLRKIHGRLEPLNKERMHAFYIIHPSLLVKLRLGILRSCGGRKMQFLRKVRTFPSLLQFLNAIKSEPTLSQRLLGALPNEIH